MFNEVKETNKKKEAKTILRQILFYSLVSLFKNEFFSSEDCKRLFYVTRL